MCNEINFVSALTLDFDEKDDFFYWSGLRYFLANYEEELQKRNNKTWDIQKILNSRNGKNTLSNDYLSREHLWASENRNGDFKPDYYEKRRLGNFILIGLGNNSSLNNLDIPDKINKLNDWEEKNKAALSLMQVIELKGFLEKAQEFCEAEHSYHSKSYFKDLSTKINDERETELIKFALKRWQLPGEKLNGFEKINTFQAGEDGKNVNYYINKPQEDQM